MTQERLLRTRTIMRYIRRVQRATGPSTRWVPLAEKDGMPHRNVGRQTRCPRSSAAMPLRPLALLAEAVARFEAPTPCYDDDTHRGRRPGGELAA